MALQGAAVGAVVGCGTVGLALYSNLMSSLRQRERREGSEDTDDCGAQIVAAARGVSRQVPDLVRDAYTDPVEELRKARESNERFATAEFSIDGGAMDSGYAVFNGEVVRAGPSVEAAEAIVAMGGAQVSRDGKTLTVVPKTPQLLLQLPSEAEAQGWEEWLRKATDKEHPVRRLEKVIMEAHAMDLADMEQMRREEVQGQGQGHAGHGHDHGHANGHADDADGHLDHAHGHADGHGGLDGELLEEMKQQLALKESTESALRQKLQYLDLQLAQKEQESQYLKAQLQAQAPQDPAQEDEVVGHDAVLKHAEEALAQERANSVAQAKALAEAHVQLKQLQDRNGAAPQEVMQLRGDVRRAEEERNAARMSLASQALDMAAMADQEAELRQALAAAQLQIERQKQLLESAQGADSASARPGSPTSKLSHSELQVLRTHMQAAVRRALEVAQEPDTEYQQKYHQKLQELDEKLVELSPTHLRNVPSSVSGSRTSSQRQDVEQRLAEITPRDTASASPKRFFEDPAEARLPLRRPSPQSSAEVQASPSPVRGAGSMSLPLAPAASTYRLSLPARPRVPLPESREVLNAEQMAANAVAATAWRGNWLTGRNFRTLPRERP